MRLLMARLPITSPPPTTKILPSGSFSLVGYHRFDVISPASTKPHVLLRLALQGTNFRTSAAPLRILTAGLLVVPPIEMKDPSSRIWPEEQKTLVSTSRG